MNLLEVYPNFQPGQGGVQRHIYDLCIESIKRNHQPIVLTWAQSAPSTENIDGILVKRIYLPRIFSILRHPMILYLSLYMFYLVKKYKVNVIHAHDYLPGQVAALTGLLSGISTIVTFHLPVPI
jgi:glycosyltransferase involved in cell wall biosynthesis